MIQDYHYPPLWTISEEQFGQSPFEDSGRRYRRDGRWQNTSVLRSASEENDGTEHRGEEQNDERSPTKALLSLMAIAFLKESACLLNQSVRHPLALSLQVAREAEIE